MTELEIFKKCVSLGMTQAGAAGCTANILTESAGRPNNVEDRCSLSDEEYTKGVDDGSYADFIEDRYGYGLCQWTLPSRKNAFLEYAKGHGVSISDADTQFHFMVREMRESYSYVWNVLTHTSDAYDAGYVMCMQFERPANTQASAEARGRKATEIYDRCKEVGKTSYDPRKVIDIAISQIGYHEKESNSQLDDPKANPGDKNWTKYARDLDRLSGFYNGSKNGFMWCDVFVDWCFVQAYGRAGAQYLLCQPDKSAGAGCSFSAGYFRSKGQFHIKDPEPGDQIFFGSSANNVWHTGLVVEVTSTHVVTVEGNTSEMVAKRSYRLNDSSIYGYGRPNWGSSGVTIPVVILEPKPSSGKTVKMCSPKIPMLEKGCENGYVKAAQVLLGYRGLSGGGEINPTTKEEIYDGQFGDITEGSVKEFQTKTHLEVDGVIGANTWAALLNL